MTRTCRGIELGWAAALAAVGWLISWQARATYSIAAVDAATGQVGGAITSCVGALDLASVYGVAPGHGVVHAQAQLDRQLRGRNRAVELLMQDVAPSDIIAMITDRALDSAAASRQYGIVDLMGRSAGYTGAQAQMYKADDQGQVATFSYSIQGNILTSQRVLDQAAQAFEADGCDLAERLMRALEAGAENGEGDSRCTPQGIPSDAAFIQVDLGSGAVGGFLSLSVSDTGPRSPLPALRAKFDEWRKTHPCAGGMPQAGAPAVAGRGGAAAVGGMGGLASGAGGGAGSTAGAGAGGSSAGSSSGDAGGSSAGIGAAGPSAGRASASQGGSAASQGGSGASAGGAAAGTASSVGGGGGSSTAGATGSTVIGARGDAVQSGETRGASGGCAVVAGRRGSSSGAWFAMVLVLLALLRRRR